MPSGPSILNDTSNKSVSKVRSSLNCESANIAYETDISPGDTQRFETLLDGDPKLKSYLLGTPTKSGERPLLVNFFAGAQPRYTFEWLPAPQRYLRRPGTGRQISEYQTPQAESADSSVDSTWAKKTPRWQVIFEAFRVQYLLFTVGIPLLLASELGWSAIAQQPIEFVLMLLSLMCLHFSVFLLDDFFDYNNGRTLAPWHPRASLIHKGHEAPFRVLQWGAIHLTLGIGLGGWLAGKTSPWLWVIGALAVISIVGYSKLQSLKLAPVSEVAVFLCWGPALLWGASLVLSGAGAPSLWAWAISGWVGAMAVVHLHLRHLQELYDDAPKKRRNFLTNLGFDWGRRWIQGEIALSLLWVSAASCLDAPMAFTNLKASTSAFIPMFGVVGLAVMLMGYVKIWVDLKKVSSPWDSRLPRIQILSLWVTALGMSLMLAKRLFAHFL